MFIYTIMSIDKILADYYGCILIVLASIGLFIYYKLNKAQLLAMKGVKTSAKRMLNSAFSGLFKRNASKTNRLNIVPPMYRGGIRL